MAERAIKKLHTSSLRAAIPSLRAGDRVLLSGTVYTARDAAHKRIAGCLAAGQPPPFALWDAVIYYAGQSDAPPGRCIGACGPTTASRMDEYAPRLIAEGVVCHIGKGDRAPAVYEAMKAYGSVYLLALGGIGALAARYITENTEIAYPELGCESIKRLTFADFPLFVGIDAMGGSMFQG